MRRRNKTWDISCFNLPQHKHAPAVSGVLELSLYCGVSGHFEGALDCLSCDIVVVFGSVENSVNRHAVPSAHCCQLRVVLNVSSFVKRTNRRCPLLQHSGWFCALGSCATVRTLVLKHVSAGVIGGHIGPHEVFAVTAHL